MFKRKTKSCNSSNISESRGRKSNKSRMRKETESEGVRRVVVGGGGADC